MVTERESMTLNEMGARALGVEERSDQTPRARGSGTGPAPDPEVAARPKRRQLTAEYRLRILEEADRCMQPGEVGRLLPTGLRDGPEAKCGGLTRGAGKAW